ncbi:hypothetical protein BRARA_G01500 [Brassica rapa]|uniref:Uncharacterized protein n=1 Tax=Brassica campestris TaxID=3711 RepID=A0A397YSY6_BRACM|nr:hypothetical protein BRARA_G01500 [Brassica rapa]
MDNSSYLSYDNMTTQRKKEKKKKKENKRILVGSSRAFSLSQNHFWFGFLCVFNLSFLLEEALLLKLYRSL